MKQISSFGLFQKSLKTIGIWSDTYIFFIFVINHTFLLQIRKLIIGRAINAEYRWDRFRGLLEKKLNLQMLKNINKNKNDKSLHNLFGCIFFILLYKYKMA